MLSDRLFELRSATYKARTDYQQAMLDYILATRRQCPPERVGLLRQTCREAAACWMSRLTVLHSYLVAHAEAEKHADALRQIKQATELISLELATLDGE